jgi:hypothetical protein
VRDLRPIVVDRPSDDEGLKKKTFRKFISGSFRGEGQREGRCIGVQRSGGGRAGGAHRQTTVDDLGGEGGELEELIFPLWLRSPATKALLLI